MQTDFQNFRAWPCSGANRLGLIAVHQCSNLKFSRQVTTNFMLLFHLKNQKNVSKNLSQQRLTLFSVLFYMCEKRLSQNFPMENLTKWVWCKQFKKKDNSEIFKLCYIFVYVSEAIKPTVSEETIFKAEAMIIFRCHFHRFHFCVVVNFSCERVNFHSFIIFLTWFYITRTKFKIKSTPLWIMYLIDLRRLDNGFSEVFEFLDRRTVSGLFAFVRLSIDFN